MGDEQWPAPEGVQEGHCLCANLGLDEEVWLDGPVIPSNVRVTVRMDEVEGQVRGSAVSPSEPRTKMGLYWGYQVRVAKSLAAVFDECPHDGGYDLSMGTSERGENLGVSRLPKFAH